jgi:hypothetical protein
MNKLRIIFKKSRLSLWLLVCILALTATSVYAGSDLRPQAAVTIIGAPDAAVTGKFAVGTASPGNKSLTVAGVIDFVGAGTVHNYFTQGPGNNMQIRSNVDEYNAVGDASKSQWNMVMGSALDVFSIRRSPAGGAYNEDALFFIDGATGDIGIATVDTGNGATIPFTPLAKLHVETTSGDAIRGVSTTTSGTNVGVYGRSYSTEGTGVYGWASAASGTTYGVRGDNSSTSGYGLYGMALATSGATHGVYGLSYSTSGIGVAGWAVATDGAAIGIYGRSTSTSGRGVSGWNSSSSGVTYGVYGQSSSTWGRGVYGWASSTTGWNYGVYGETDSTAGTGMFAWATATSGSTFGLRAGSDSTSGKGVEALVNATSGITYGIYGLSESTSGYGVYGLANATSGINYGVYGGTNSASGYAGYFNGNVHISGTLSKSAGSFRIDHPLDPENMYLQHSFVESPDMKNIYDGVVTLDEKGEALVVLPVWFEALNMDFRYQLTPLGASMPDLYVATGIEDNVFQIAGGVAGVQVSWQVTGIRHDPYAEAHRIQVELEKPSEVLAESMKSGLMVGRSRDALALDSMLDLNTLPKP